MACTRYQTYTGQLPDSYRTGLSIIVYRICSTLHTTRATPLTGTASGLLAAVEACRSEGLDTAPIVEEKYCRRHMADLLDSGS